MFEDKENKFLGQGLASSSANTVLTFEDIYEATMTVSCSFYSHYHKMQAKPSFQYFMKFFFSKGMYISFLMVFFFKRNNVF